MSALIVAVVVVATYYFLKWLTGCDHEWIAPNDSKCPIFCRKCFKQGIGRSEVNDRVRAATVEEERAFWNSKRR